MGLVVGVKGLAFRAERALAFAADVDVMARFAALGAFLIAFGYELGYGSGGLVEGVEGFYFWDRGNFWLGGLEILLVSQYQAQILLNKG